MPDDLPLARASVVDDCEFDRLVLKLLLGNLFAPRRQTREKVEHQDNEPSFSLCSLEKLEDKSSSNPRRRSPAKRERARDECREKNEH